VAIVLIIGASRGIGLETVRAALEAGHSVRALARSARRIPVDHPKLEKMAGDALEMVEGGCVAFCGAARSRERSNQRYTILPLRALTPSS